jgi:dTDP-4-amino-4,6-dideoxygalactose transaminase
MSTYKNKPLGTIGHLGAFSFHETKNYTSGGEGGLLIINDDKFRERAEIIREKGTNRSLFFQGMVDKYSWVDIGSSYLPSELQAAYLFGQLESATKINNDRLSSWEDYYQQLKVLEDDGHIRLPFVPEGCAHNAHMFYIKTKGGIERAALISYLKENQIMSVFHYIPLHTSEAGYQFSRFHGEDIFTTQESECLLRLPLYFGLTKHDLKHVVDAINAFYS